ncbi:CPBP family intramembrane glutamic endopeptidase [Microlunatus speluncae]|uniref:CPBP family intramembrane glutamic endopeptidase n=1 Tax=Microlunatus speluncae TaxID=2594267 RepID=UPI001375587A|nr:CPBP family intramembrane glutamic endopeptidase [Microlunatus speluncae]
MRRRVLGMLLIFATACVLLTVLMSRSELLFGPYTLANHAVRAVLMTVLVVGAVLLVCRLVTRRPIGSLGLPPQRAAGQLGLGVLLWLVPAGVTTAILLAAGLVTFTPQQPAGDIVIRLLGLIVLVALFEAIPEEVVFRGFLYGGLAEIWPRWAAAIGQAVLFTAAGAISGAAATPDRVLMFAVFSLTLGCLRVLCGTAWVTMGFHLAFQTAAQGLIGNEGLRPFGIAGEDWLAGVAFVLVPFVVAIAGAVALHHRRPALVMTNS